jgi:histidine triad (HIT) family protein
MSEHDCLFCAILQGEEPAKVIHKDEAAQMALIQSLHPEGAIHWLAIPFEHVVSVEALAQQNSARFQELIAFALAATRQQVDDFPDLHHGFTLKMHIGPFETISHAKVHILSVE